MIHRPPAPKLVVAKLHEIKRRYEHHAKVSKRSRPMAAIRLAELTRWLDDAYGAGIELDAAEHSETIARIFTHHLVVLNDGNRRAAQWLATYTPWISLRSRETMISEANHCPIKWSADKLAWKIRLTDAKRTELKIRTIGAIDCNADERKARRKTEHAARQRRLRASKRAQHIY